MTKPNINNKINFLNKSFDLAISFLFFLIAPLIFIISGINYFQIVEKADGLGMIGVGMAYLFSFPIIFFIEIIVFFLTKFFIKKFSQKKYKDYVIALMISGVGIIIVLFFSFNLLLATIAISTNNVFFCKIMTMSENDENDKKESCFFKIAMTTMNESVCNFKLDNYKNDCLKEVRTKKEEQYYGLAIEKKDISLCEKAGKFKGNCYYKFAILNNDPILCEKVINPVAEVIEISPGLHGSEIKGQGDCYLKLMKSIKDKTICDKFKTWNWLPQEIESCYNTAGYLPDLIIEDVKLTKISLADFMTEKEITQIDIENDPSLKSKYVNKLKFSIKVKNIGKRDAGRFEVSVMENNKEVYNIILVDKLNQGETKEVENFIFIRGGLKKYTIEADHFNEVQELNEINNKIQKEFYFD